MIFRYVVQRDITRKFRTIQLEFLNELCNTTDGSDSVVSWTKENELRFLFRTD